MTTFCGLLSVWYWYHWFVLLGGMKMSGSAGLFNNFFYLVGSPKVGGAGDGKHKQKYGHPKALDHRARIYPYLKHIQDV